MMSPDQSRLELEPWPTDSSMAVHDKKEPDSSLAALARKSGEDVEAGQDVFTPLPPWQAVVLVFSLCVGTLLVAIDTTIVSVAVPAISTEFRAFEDVGWYGAAYLFTVTAFQPAFGSVFRFFDAKWAYLSSIVWFEGL